MAENVVEFRPRPMKCEEIKAEEGVGQYMFEGEARCLACKHTWAARAPAGTIDLECPECHSFRGAHVGPYEVPNGTRVWECYHCTSQIFMVMEGGFSFCLGCGFISRI